MTVPDTDQYYKERKRYTQKYYSAIGRIWCPLLNDYIIFNQSGFDHLVRKGRKPRPKNDQLRRFALLHFAKNIIEDENTKLIRQENRDIQTHSLPLWVIAGKTEKEIIIIVVRENGVGEKYFFSIYN